MDTGIVVVTEPTTPDVTDRFALEEARCFRAVSKDRRACPERVEGRSVS
jgi:RNA polymerase subunit RPABC4/transcription elongation factor Spt4